MPKVLEDDIKNGEKNENEEKSEDVDKYDKPANKPEDYDHDVQGEMLLEVDTTTFTSGPLS